MRPLADRGAEVYEVHNRYPDGSVVTTPNLDPWVMEVDNDYVNRTLGVEFTPQMSAHELGKMGHGAEVGGGVIKVLVPSYRADVMHPIDLVEDIAIAHRYDSFEPVIPAISCEAGEDPLEVFSRKLRNFMVGLGLLEVVTFMMSNREKLFHRMSLPEEPICETENPKMEAYDSLRNRLLPGLMEVLSANKHHPYPQSLPSTETGARSRRRLAVVLCHSGASFSEIKAAMNTVLENLGVGVEVEEGGWGCFIEGRRFTATLGGESLCWAGEVRPEVLESWELEMPVAALEMDVEALFRVFS